MPTTDAGRAGVAPSPDRCSNNPYGPEHQWHRDGTRHDLNGREYWIDACQLCGYTVYRRCEEEVLYERG